jgi:Protein of unknown function (DUF2950)
MRLPGGWRGKHLAIFTLLWLGLTLAPTVAAQPAQETFASPEDALAAFVAAARAHDLGKLRAIFGPAGEKLLSSGDPYADAAQERRFVEGYDQKHALVTLGPGRVEVDVGPDAWPLPIPIVQTGDRWRFDTEDGAQEIVNRRIGRNEFAAIRVSLAYVAAQKDYFARARERTGAGVYAQRLISRKGHHDGLYWPAAEGEEESPLGPLIATASEEGYPGERAGGKPIPYQGYYFRILKAQGPDAPDGAKTYVHSARMTGGFALIAWPAGYGASGIMTFQVNQDGIVFQKDLGPNTAKAVVKITRFDPDLTWARVDLTEH